jgi:hypothetical protein
MTMQSSVVLCRTVAIVAPIVGLRLVYRLIRPFSGDAPGSVPLGQPS